jgi:ribosomal protein S18 acetylase RimI-like enzyme
VIELGPFTKDQYAAWKPVSIADYAAEHVKSGRWSAGDAPAKAQEEFGSLLPEGTETPGHHFYSIVRSSDRMAVGMIWVQTGRVPGRAFVFNLEIFAPYRRKGYAEQAMRVLEDEVRRMGDSSIGLHVFAHNTAARRLYEKLGYAETNITMLKRL